MSDQKQGGKVYLRGDSAEEYRAWRRWAEADVLERLADGKPLKGKGPALFKCIIPESPALCVPTAADPPWSRSII